MARILLVEDSHSLNNLLCKQLSQFLVVDQAHRITDAQFLFDTKDYDLVVTDLDLPDGSGLDLAQYIRADKNNVPILFLTAETQLQHKLACLRIRHTDYITKPFHMLELQARVKSLLEVTLIHNREVRHLGALELDVEGWQVKRGGREIKLNRKEFLLLECFLHNIDRILSKALLASQVWSSDEALFGNSIEVTIASLRAKIGKEYITTIKGKGYIMRSR